jgi:hypothetical protein
MLAGSSIIVGLTLTPIVAIWLFHKVAASEKMVCRC